MAYLYKDPNGLAFITVNDGETPGQALDRLSSQTGVQWDPRVIANARAASAPPPPPPAPPPPAPPDRAPSPPVESAPPAPAATPTPPSVGVAPVPVANLRPRLAPIVTGEPITTGIATAIGVIASIFGGGGDSALQSVVDGLQVGFITLSNVLSTTITLLSNIAKGILDVLKKIWQNILKALIDLLNKILGALAVIINNVLKPILQLIDHIRKQILGIYARFFLPVIAMLQKIRKVVALLALLHVPGMKQLDQKLARIQGKVFGVIQALLSRVNDHSGLLNILMSARLVLQHDVLVRSMYETQGAWINQWWNAQEAGRDPADEAAGVQLDVQIQSQPHKKALDDMLATGVYTANDTTQPHEAELYAMLQAGPA